MELATKIVPLFIGVISGETGPSQTDRVDGIDLNVRLGNNISVRFSS